MEKEEKNTKSFEENLEELAKIVEKLEAGETPLDHAIEEFQKAMVLAKNCDEKLKNAQDAIHKIVSDDNEIKNFEMSE